MVGTTSTARKNTQRRFSQLERSDAGKLQQAGRSWTGTADAAQDQEAAARKNGANSRRSELQKKLQDVDNLCPRDRGLPDDEWRPTTRRYDSKRRARTGWRAREEHERLRERAQPNEPTGNGRSRGGAAVQQQIGPYTGQVA